MADVITYPAIQDDSELEVAVAEYLDAKHWVESATAHKKAREVQIKDYMGMASSKELENGIKVSVSMPIIKNVFDSKAFKAADPSTYNAYSKTRTDPPRLTITMPKAGDE